MTTWTFIAFMLFLKVPLGAVIMLFRSAMKEDAAALEEFESDDGGSKVTPDLGPREPRDPTPAPTRRGPHGGAAVPAPARVRVPTRQRDRVGSR